MCNASRYKFCLVLCTLVLAAIPFSVFAQNDISSPYPESGTGEDESSVLSNNPASTSSTPGHPDQNPTIVLM